MRAGPRFPACRSSPTAQPHGCVGKAVALLCTNPSELGYFCISATSATSHGLSPWQLQGPQVLCSITLLHPADLFFKMNTVGPSSKKSN